MSKCFIVLGMHRSATSLAAKGLFQSGVFIGNELLGASRSNPYGHYEDRAFLILNEEILGAAGGSWSEPPTESNIIVAARAFEEKIKALINSRQNKYNLWGWKDPRTVLTIKCYLPFIENPHFITCFREPVEVAKSLVKRDDITIDKAMSIAEEYNRRLLGFLTDFVNEDYYKFYHSHR